MIYYSTCCCIMLYHFAQCYSCALLGSGHQIVEFSKVYSSNDHDLSVYLKHLKSNSFNQKQTTCNFTQTNSSQRFTHQHKPLDWHLVKQNQGPLPSITNASCLRTCDRTTHQGTVDAFNQRHSDWSTKTMNCKDPQGRTLPCILKDFCPWPTALCAIWWTWAIPNQWCSVQATEYLPEASPSVQNPSAPRNPRNTDGTIQWDDVRFSQVMVSAGSQRLQRHDLINGSFQKRWQLLPQSEGHVLVKTQNMWMTGWCKDFEELEWFADSIVSYGKKQASKCENIIMFLSKHLSTNQQPATLYTRKSRCTICTVILQYNPYQHWTIGSPCTSLFLRASKPIASPSHRSSPWP